jgi:hypothetical protein
MEQEWLIIVMLINSAVLLLFGIVLYRLRRSHLKQLQQNSTIQNDLGSLCNAAVTVGEKVSRIEHQLHQLDERQEVLDQRQDQISMSGGERQSFDQAIKLAKKGAAVGELVDLCGLSKGEAELLAMMQRMENQP